MRLEPIGNPIDEKAGDMVGLLAGWAADMHGGRNLLLDSYVNVANDTYLTTTVSQVPGHGLKDGDPFVITLKGQLGGDKTQFVIYNSDERTQVANMRNSNQDDDGVYTITGTWKVSANNNHLRIYAFPSSGTSETSIEWVKLSRGTHGTSWTPAPEEVAADIKATGGTDLPNPLPPVDHSLALRLDTSVGTRIFAGDTMIHGDTGRRSVPELSTSIDVSTSNLHGIYIRRVGDMITLTATGVWVSGQWITETIPSGFRPHSADYLGARGVATVDRNIRTFGNFGTLLRLSFSTPFPSAGDSIALNASWHTSDPWPTTLPGLPA